MAFDFALIWIAAAFGIMLALDIARMLAGYRRPPLSPQTPKRINNFVHRRSAAIVKLYADQLTQSYSHQWANLKGGAVHWKDAIAPVMGYVDGYPSAAFTLSGELRKGEPIYNTRDAYVASEGGGLRAFGAGGMGTQIAILIIFSVLIIGAVVFTFIQMNNSLNTVQAQNAALKDEVLKLYQQLLNMTISKATP